MKEKTRICESCGKSFDLQHMKRFADLWKLCPECRKMRDKFRKMHIKETGGITGGRGRKVSSETKARRRQIECLEKIESYAKSKSRDEVNKWIAKLIESGFDLDKSAELEEMPMKLIARECRILLEKK